ncbi:PQQ-like beta-propeller repeat protein [Dactylosporangium fulvum]|uniref:PQQ-like beta-propeller repeat protein n=1 Tax=Dactylosporangium fulvum TaxID=53359 RepID=A0ABY5W2M9_9ACTN|nr:PQQ-like beta-propeller repeat protein [Dactylosporangium fulvum]UWP84308.1 PQQ-like beta-propeller repeat protein [Dactylosporangium fulvum]
MGDSFIELGELRPATDSVEWVPLRQRPGPVGAGRRQWPIVAVLALVAVFASGSLPVRQVEKLAVLAEHTVGFVADRTTLYTLGEEQALTAYDWSTGQVRWSRAPAADGGQVYLAADRAYVRHRPCTTTVGWSLERLDPKTGEEAWTRSGAPIAVLAGPPGEAPGLLAVDELRPSCPPVVPTRNSPPQTSVRLAGLDAETGAIRWAFEPPAGSRLVAPEVPGSDWFAVWYPGGRTEVRSAVNGAVVSAADLPELADGPPTSVRIVGDLLVVVSVRNDGALITAYGKNPLRYRWDQLFQSAEPVPIAELAYGPVVVACGPMLCVPNWRDIAVLDPATGRQQWRRQIQLDGIGPGVLVARDRGDFMRIRVVDWRTGRDLDDLRGWGVVPTATDGTDGTDVEDTTATGSGMPYVLVQKPEGDSSQLARIDLRTGGICPLGTVSPIPSRCAIRGSRLSCLADGDSVHLWRLPAP